MTEWWQRLTLNLPVPWQDDTEEDDVKKEFAPRDWFEWMCLVMVVMLIAAIVLSFTAGLTLLMVEACLLLGGVVLAWLTMAVL